MVGVWYRDGTQMVAVWKVQPGGLLKEAFNEMDGSIAGTYGECKQGIGLTPMPVSLFYK